MCIFVSKMSSGDYTFAQVATVGSAGKMGKGETQTALKWAGETKLTLQILGALGGATAVEDAEFQKIYTIKNPIP